MRYIEHALAHGIARHRAGHFREARSVYESLLSMSMDPNICSIALANLSAIHETAGRWDEARLAASEALHINKTNGVALISAIRCDRFAGHPEKGLERLQQWPSYSLPPDLIHEMALCFEALGEMTKAYHSFREANRRSSFENLDVDRGLVTRYIEKMLSAHNTPETDVGEQPIHGLEPSPIFIVGFGSNGGKDLGHLLAQQESCGLLGDLPALDAARKSLNGKDFEPLHQLSSEEIVEAREAYFGVSVLRVPTGTRVVDTTPLNVLSLPVIHRIFPDACIIRLVRHPVETVFQAFRKLNRVNAITCHTDSMSRCTQLFMAANAMGNHYRDTLGIPMHDLLYEDFRQAPNQFGKAIIESLGDTWTDVAAYHAACPVDLWRQYDAQLAPWTRETKTLAQSLGYPAK